MLIVDAQVHIWSAGKPANLNHRQVERFTKDDLLKERDAAAVNAARQHPDRFAILGNFPLDPPESRGLVDGWKRRPGILGLRYSR